MRSARLEHGTIAALIPAVARRITALVRIVEPYQQRAIALQCINATDDWSSPAGASMSYRLRLAHLYPEQMNIYGDRGNILTLTRRCAWRGITVDLLLVGVDAEVDWGALDIAFFGGGQDSGQALIAADFVEHQGPALHAAIEDG